MNLLKLYWVIIDGDEGHFEIYRSSHAARQSRDHESADHGITPTVPEPVPMLLDPVLAEPLVKEAS